MSPTLLALALLASPIPVEVRKTADGWQLLRGGKPYAIHGVGGTQRMVDFVEAGGNSMRGWGVDRAGEELEAMHRLGITYSVGIWLGHKAYFDYANEKQVKEQADNVRRAILELKDHPALLIWGLGNEMENGNDTPELWKAIDDLHKMAKELDPNHPAMTVVAEIYPEKIANIKKYAPNLQILGVNSYAGLPSLAKRLKDAGWDKPFVVTEFGPAGTWERPKTPWGAALEQTSTEKADHYLAGYQATIKDPACLGSYAFLWGEKQEETPTWFGMYLLSGERLASVDAMTYAWTGKWPAKRAPRIDSFELSIGSKEVAPGAAAVAQAITTDPDGDQTTCYWSIKREVADKRFAGQGEQRPAVLFDVLNATVGPKIEFAAPKTPGAYRLYLTVLDGTGRAATANAPFLVKAAQ